MSATATAHPVDRLQTQSGRNTAVKLARALGASFLIWTAVSVFAMVATYQFSAADGKTPELSTVVLQPLLRYWVWAVLSIPLFYLTKRFPVTLRTLPQSLAIHVIVFPAAIMAAVIGRWSLKFIGFPLPGFASVGAIAQAQFSMGFISAIWTYVGVIAASHAIMY